MLNYLAKITLQSKIARENLSRQKKFIGWDNIEKIALVLGQEDSINKSSIDKFIDETKKFVEVFYVEPNSKQASFGDWQCFYKKDKSFLSLPKKSVHDELKNKKFDVVINTSGERDFFSVAVTSSLKAYLKCGRNNMFNDLDLIIKKTEPFVLGNYLNDTVKYLKMIKV